MIALMRFAIVLLLLAGCSSAPTPAPEPSPAPVEQAPAPQPQSQPQSRETTAIASLIESARTDAAAGRLTNAAASLERALRIEPRNPRLWHELARVRLEQREYSQAQSMALRSNSLAGADNTLRAENGRIMEQASAGLPYAK